MDEFGKSLKFPLSVTFVANMLNQQGYKEIAEELEDLNIELLKGSVSLVNVGLLLSNDKSHIHVERNLKSENPNFIMLSLNINEPKEFLEECYSIANETLRRD